MKTNCAGVHMLIHEWMMIMKCGKTLAEIEHLNQAGNAMLDQLTWWAFALKRAREEESKTAQAA